MTSDVFNHHNRIVNHKTRCDGQRHQTQIVDGEPCQVHDGEGTDQRQRDSHRRNNGGRNAAQEQVDHHHHEGNCQHQLGTDIVDRSANRDGAICQHLQFSGSRQTGLQLWQQGFNAINDFNDVGTGLALHIEDHGRLPVHPGSKIGVLGTLADLGNLT